MAADKKLPFRIEKSNRKIMKWYMFGEERDSERITVQEITEVMAAARTHCDEVRQAPIDYILDTLDRVGRVFADTQSERYRHIVDTMHGQLGWSREMVAEGLAIISDVLTYDHLMTRLEADLDNPRQLDEFCYNRAFRGMVKAEPFGVVAHVSAGNVFVGAVDTLVQGLVTKNVNILKMSSADPVFPMIFSEIVREVDTVGTVARAFALVPFKGGDKEVERVVKAEADVLVVYGGKETVEAYREGAGFHTKIIEYGPKYSLSIIDASLIDDDSVKDVCRDLARDFTMWEQSACSSPHVVFVDDPAKARLLANALAAALQDWAVKIPHSTIPINEAVEITRTRELARVDQALGEAELIIPAEDCQDWTVVLQHKCAFKVSPHHRTAFVVTSPCHETATLEALRPYGQFIQSVSLLMPTARRLALASKLVALGTDRITDIGWMARRKHGTPHDGTRGTSELVRWVSIGSDRPFETPFDYLPDDERERITLLRLNAFLHYVREHSPFYTARLPQRDLNSLDELATLPILSPDELKANLPPKGNGLLTAPIGGSIAFSSGGTTGDPKCIYRTHAENHENARLIGKGYALSIFNSEDVVANLLYAGNMWASFLSHNEAIEATGAHVLPIAGNIAMEDIVSALRAYQPTGAVSIPSVILGIAEYVKTHGITDLSLRKIVTGGEHLYPEAKAFIREVLHTEQFASTGYLSNDTGCIGFQCEALANLPHEPAPTSSSDEETFAQGVPHHIHEDYCIMEVVDPETGQPVADGEVGKILVTNYRRRFMPLVRYDIGDMGRILTHRCSCGRTVKLMELLGRSDDTLIIGAGNITAGAVAHVLGHFSELSAHFRLVAETRDRKDLLIVEAESLAPLTPESVAALEARVYDCLMLEKPILVTGLKSGIILRPIVRVVPPASLPRNPRTGKLKLTVDRR